MGAEAIAMGVPTLVSGRSGLGVLLREILPPANTARVVAPMTMDDDRDIATWGAHAAAMLRDPKAAFTAARAVRRAAARRRPWARSARQLLRAIPALR